MADLRKREAVAALALEFTVLNASRSGEVLGAKWNEIDRDAKVWTVPPERMKAGREHRVPLTKRALEILDTVEKVRTGDYVFPGQRRGRPLSGMCLFQHPHTPGSWNTPGREPEGVPTPLGFSATSGDLLSRRSPWQRLRMPDTRPSPQNAAQGMSIVEAYEHVGYSRNDGNAARLRGNERVMARIRELQDEAKTERSLVLQLRMLLSFVVGDSSSTLVASAPA